MGTWPPPRDQSNSTSIGGAYLHGRELHATLIVQGGGRQPPPPPPPGRTRGGSLCSSRPNRCESPSLHSVPVMIEIRDPNRAHRYGRWHIRPQSLFTPRYRLSERPTGFLASAADITREEDCDGCHRSFQPTGGLFGGPGHHEITQKTTAVPKFAESRADIRIEKSCYITAPMS